MAVNEKVRRSEDFDRQFVSLETNNPEIHVHSYKAILSKLHPDVGASKKGGGGEVKEGLW